MMLALSGVRCRTSHSVVATSSVSLLGVSSALTTAQRHFRKELFEGPLDLKPGERGSRKGPPVAHSLPVYKTAHKLNNSVRWKNANLITNVAGGKDYRLRETQGEGTFDETGMYRDWLYGDERRYANYVGLALGALSIFLFFYTMKVMGTETWDIPAPVLASQRKKVAAATSTTTGENASDATSSSSTTITTTKGGETTEALEYGTIKEEDALALLKRPKVVSKATQ